MCVWWSLGCGFWWRSRYFSISLLGRYIITLAVACSAPLLFLLVYLIAQLPRLARRLALTGVNCVRFQLCPEHVVGEEIMMFEFADDDSASTDGEEEVRVVGTETADCVPFVLHREDVEVLAQSDGFTILRNHLADTYDYV